MRQAIQSIQIDDGNVCPIEQRRAEPSVASPGFLGPKRGGLVCFPGERLKGSSKLVVTEIFGSQG